LVRVIQVRSAYDGYDGVGPGDGELDGEAVGESVGLLDPLGPGEPEELAAVDPLGDADGDGLLEGVAMDDPDAAGVGVPDVVVAVALLAVVTPTMDSTCRS
jgi:hypothetical protein